MRGRAAALAALVAAQAARGEPALGVDEQPRRGTYVETTAGVFSALGGSRAFSTAQPYLGLSFGREVGGRASVFASLGLGAASASCYQLSPGGADCQAADSFGATFAEAGLAFGVPLSLRTLVSLKAVFGVTSLSPGPVREASGVPDSLFGPHGGLGLALDYATHLDHFAVGVDALVRHSFVRYTPAPGSTRTLGLSSLSFLPRIRYVF